MNLFALFFIGICGIFLPVVTLAFEYCTALSASEYFDPIPTLWHGLAVAFVPAANGVVLYFVLRRSKVPPYFLGYLSAVSYFVAVVYALPYLPLAPIAVPGILFYGIGLLPLAPLLAAISALVLRRGLKKRGLLSPKGRVPGVLNGFVTVTVLLLALEFQPAMTHIGLAMAVSGDSGRQAAGLSILRAVGDDKVLLSECYGKQGRMVDPFSAMVRSLASTELTNDKTREIFFRATGVPLQLASASALDGPRRNHQPLVLRRDPWRTGDRRYNSRTRSDKLSDQQLGGCGGRRRLHGMDPGVQE